MICVPRCQPRFLTTARCSRSTRRTRSPGTSSARSCTPRRPSGRRSSTGSVLGSTALERQHAMRDRPLAPDPAPVLPVTDGPELDAVLDGDRAWSWSRPSGCHPRGTGQGPDGQRVGQMHLRQQFFARWGEALYGERGKLALSVGLRGKLTPDHGPDHEGIAARSITWSDLATCDAHPHADEFSRYLTWKLAR